MGAPHQLARPAGGEEQPEHPAAEGRQQSSRTRLIAVFGGAQLFIALGALIRVPITSSAIGVAGLGSVVAVSAIVPLLLIPGAGLRLTSRTLMAEAEGLGAGQVELRRLARDGCRLGRRIGAVLLVVLAPLAFANPLRLPDGWWMVGAVIATIGLSALALDGMWWWGTIEAFGRADLPNILVIGVTILGTVAAYVLSLSSSSVAAFALLAALTSTVPLIAMSAVGRRLTRLGIGGTAGDSGRDWRINTNVRRFSLRAGVEALTRGTDPIIINLVVSASAVGVYSVAQRLGLGISLVAGALIPKFMADAARRRGRGTVGDLADVRRLMAQQGGIAGALAVGFVVLAPFVAELLAGEDARGPLRLYFAIALLGVLMAVETPLSATMTGPRALKSATLIGGIAGGVNLVLSVVLAFAIGMTGPVLASIAATLAIIVAQYRFLAREPGVLAERTA